MNSPSSDLANSFEDCSSLNHSEPARKKFRGKKAVKEVNEMHSGSEFRYWINHGSLFSVSLVVFNLFFSLLTASSQIDELVHLT